MFLKPRLESDELRTYYYLDARMKLDSKDKQQFINLVRGFEGESEFDGLLEQLGNEYLIMNDLLLAKHNTFFQIDSLVISHDTIYLFEIKNYEGDYYIEGDKWYLCSGTEIQSPLIQLKRNETLLRRFLQPYQLSHITKAFLVFINPEFTLYKAPRDEMIIFPSQLKRFMKGLSLGKPQLMENQLQLAKKILAEHQDKSPYTRLPTYKYEQLQKGIICWKCRAIETKIDGGQLLCSICSAVENADSAILRSVEELRLLFPERKLTTNAIYEWCGAMVSKKTIRRVMKANYELTGHGRTAHFIKK